MFAVIYSFEVKPNCDQQLIQSWKELTELIYKHEGSLGSRLHKAGENKYIAYAQWPEKEIWENSGNLLPDSASEIRKQMKEACVSIETLFELETIEDLLQSQTSIV